MTSTNGDASKRMPHIMVSNDNSNDIPWIQVGIELLKFTVCIGITVYFTNKTVNLVSAILNSDNRSKQSRELAKKILAKRLKRPDVECMEFDSFEEKLLNEIIGPDELDVTFEDIGGMECELEDVKDNIVVPIQLWNKYKSVDDLSCCPTGVLLYGAPGTGKSLTAKAIAKESGATFLSIKASTILDKYVGETEKLVSAIFSLSRKLAPTIIFIDEIETVLRKRGGSSSQDHSVLQSMQGVFLSEWDGLTADYDIGEDIYNNSSKNNNNTTSLQQHQQQQKQLYRAPVVVLGATNRPTDLDKAFLRRMPVQIQTHVPNAVTRAAILQAQLKNELLSEDVNLLEIAERTSNFTGSDIRELVRVAKQQRAKAIANNLRRTLSLDENEGSKNNSSDIHNDNSSSEQSSSSNRSNTVSDSSSNESYTLSSSSSMQKQRIPLTQANFNYALSKTNSSISNTKEFGFQQAATELFERLGKGFHPGMENNVFQT